MQSFTELNLGFFNEPWFGTILRKREKFELSSMVPVIIFK